jgi:light-independent protochlorophyllide reductase subunit B
VAGRIAELRPELVCGTQMERHACRKLDLPCMVIAPPTHIENHLLSYKPFLGFDGADVIADEVYTTATLGMEKHLIDLFGDAGLEYEADTVTGGRGDTETRGQGDTETEAVDQTSSAVITDLPASPSQGLLVWTPEAQGMLKKIPFFVRGRVQQKIERYAAEHGHASITSDVVLVAKEELGG